MAGSFLDTPPELRDLQIDVNLRGVVNGMGAVLPGMVARGRGHVVNVASLAGRIATPHAAVYTATKFAVVGLTEAVRAELHGTGVRASAVLPTFVHTEMTEGLPLDGIPTVDRRRRGPGDPARGAPRRAGDGGGAPVDGRVAAAGRVHAAGRSSMRSGTVPADVRGPCRAAGGVRGPGTRSAATADRAAIRGGADVRRTARPLNFG